MRDWGILSNERLGSTSQIMRDCGEYLSMKIGEYLSMRDCSGGE